MCCGIYQSAIVSDYMRWVNAYLLPIQSGVAAQCCSYIVITGDIGYEPEEVERKLERLFNLGLKWGCVLLLDEADTFLGKRNKDDVKRNGLVSGRLPTP